jgi:hypothetical protein
MQRGIQMTLVGLMALVAFLVGALVSGVASLPEARAETGGHSPNMIAVTGLIGSGVSVLYVIDTEKKQLAVYNAMGGKEIRFVAARRIKYDLELKQFNDASPRAVSPDLLKKMYDAEKGAQDTGKGDNPRRKK